MRLTVAELASQLGATLLVPPRHADCLVQRVYAGDRMSDIISEAGDDTLIVTNVDGAQLLRAANLMDTLALCLVQGREPRPDTVAEAAQHGTALLVAPWSLYETCGRIFRLAQEEDRQGS